MKYLKTFEQFDSPELKGKFTPDEIRKMTFAKSPWTGDYKTFRYGSYSGEASVNLNTFINQARFKGNDSMFGVSEYFVSMLYKEIPDFKNYELKNYDDFDKGRLGIHLRKSVKLNGTRFSAESEIWVYYHTKRDKILDYDNGKIYLLFVCGLRPTEKSFDLMGSSKKKEGEGGEEEKEVRQSFSELVRPPSTCNNCETDDEKGFDKFYMGISELLSGHPDSEDENLHKRLEIKFKNLSLPRLEVCLKKVNKNLDYFKKYVSNKYNLTF